MSTPPPAPVRRRPAAPAPHAFAPLSGELPARVRFAAWYFSASGALGLLLMAVGLGAVLLGAGPAAGARVSPLAVALNALTGAGWLWTGRLLAAGERRGAVSAAVTLLVPVLARLGGQPVSTSTLVLGTAGAVAVLSAWRDLR